MGHQSTNFGDQAFYGDKQWCPARVSKGGDYYISIFQISVFHVEDDTCSSLYNSGRNRETYNCFGWEIFPFVLTCNDFTIRRDNTWRSEFFIECVLVFSLADDLVIQFLCAYDFAKFFKSEIEDIFFFMKNIGLYELFGFFQ